MKRNEKRWILILIIITIIMIVKLNLRDNNKEINTNGNNNIEQNESVQVVEKVTFSDIKTEFDTGITTISAKITNNSNETRNFTVNITLRDENGRILQKLTQVVENLEQGESKILSTGIFGDYSKTSNIKFELSNQ